MNRRHFLTSTFLGATAIGLGARGALAAYVEGGPPVYPLEEACQDRYLDILIQQAQETGQTITAETQAWAG